VGKVMPLSVERSIAIRGYAVIVVSVELDGEGTAGSKRLSASRAGHVERWRDRVHGKVGCGLGSAARFVTEILPVVAPTGTTAVSLVRQRGLNGRIYEVVETARWSHR